MMFVICLGFSELLSFSLDRPVLDAMGVVICNVESVGEEAG